MVLRCTSFTKLVLNLMVPINFFIIFVVLISSASANYPSRYDYFKKVFSDGDVNIIFI